MALGFVTSAEFGQRGRIAVQISRNFGESGDALLDGFGGEQDAYGYQVSGAGA